VNRLLRLCTLKSHCGPAQDKSAMASPRPLPLDFMQPRLFGPPPLNARPPPYDSTH
jgi:hypothetical protein